MLLTESMDQRENLIESQMFTVHRKYGTKGDCYRGTNVHCSQKLWTKGRLLQGVQSSLFTESMDQRDSYSVYKVGFYIVHFFFFMLFLLKRQNDLISFQYNLAHSDIISLFHSFKPKVRKTFMNSQRVMGSDVIEKAFLLMSISL